MGGKMLAKDAGTMPLRMGETGGKIRSKVIPL